MAPRIGNSESPPEIQRRRQPSPPPSPPAMAHPLLQELLETHVEVMRSISGRHVGIRCDVCDTSDFHGYRYKCAVCENYDLCAFCFEERNESLDHKKHHPLILLESDDNSKQYSDLHKSGLEKLNRKIWDKNVVHHFGCNPCGNNIPIKGLAIVCDDCKGGYRMCYECWAGGKMTEGHQKNHSVILKMSPNDHKLVGVNIGLDDKLGSSAFGVVHKAAVNGGKRLVRLCKTRQDFISSLSIEELQKLQDGMEIYNEFHCEFIIQFKGYNLTESLALMVSEYMRNKSLGDHLGKESYGQINKANRFQYCETIIRALFRMHKKGILHKDLKSDKVLLTDFGTAKLGNRGFGFDPEKKTESTNYSHETSYHPRNDANKCSPSYDVYAYGLLFNEIFTEKKNVSLTQQDCLNKFKVPYFGDMIAACIDPDERKRPSTECVKNYLLAFREVIKEYWGSQNVTVNDPDVLTMNTRFDRAYQSFISSTTFKVETDDSFEENERR